MDSLSNRECLLSVEIDEFGRQDESDYEKGKLTVWKYPVEKKYIKIYSAMKKIDFLPDRKL